MADAGKLSQPGSVSRRVLLVEDNDLNRQLLSDYLVIFGYQVQSLASGEGLFEALADFHPELIILDLKLPNKDGYTLLEQIQRSDDWRQIPVIVVSAFAFRTYQQRAQSLGARQYLVKPVALNDLRRAIQVELDG